MKKLSKLLFKITCVLFICCALSSCSHKAQNASISKRAKLSLSKKVENIILSNNERAHVGIQIVSLSNNEVLYEKNSHHLFVPASNVKLFTASHALHELGGNYIFHTKFLADGPVKNGVLEGNIYLKGDGDPSLKTDGLNELIRALKLSNINTIKGKLFIDDAIFDNIPWGPGWMWDEGSEGFAAPISGININDNCVLVTVQPTKIGCEPLVSLKPDLGYFVIENNALTSEKTSLFVNRKWRTNERTIKISGSISNTSDVKKHFVSIDNPTTYIYCMTKKLMKDADIILEENALIPKFPNNKIILANHYSAPLKTILIPFLENSHNMTGECLHKKIGSIANQRIGSWKNSNISRKNFLKRKFNLHSKQYRLVDGSGLSRYNLLSPKAITKLLYCEKENQIFRQALPVNGKSGTLKNRLLDVKLLRKIQAKTGSMSGVSALSGYMETMRHGTVAFSIISNGFTENLTTFRKLEEELCLLFATEL